MDATFNNQLSKLKSNFPNYHLKIEKLFKNDEHFVEIASDFLMCEKALNLLTDKNTMEMERHYEQTKKELEEELLSYLEDHKMEE